MAFVEEYPVNQELLNRFDWTALPLLYQGEAGEYCNIPRFVLVDYGQDLVYYTGGGGVGRTTRIIQPNTEVLYFQGVPVRFVLKLTDEKSYKDEIRNKYIFTWKEYSVIRIVVPISLLKQEKEIIDSIAEAVESMKNSEFMTNAQNISVKISTEVEYI